MKFFNNLFRPKRVLLGDLKHLDEITLNDMQSFPVWVNDLSGEHIEGFNETSERPILNFKNVSKKILSQYVSIAILIKLPEKQFGAVNIDKDWKAHSAVIWKDNEWIFLHKYYVNLKNITFVSIPRLNSKSNVKFDYNLKEDIGNIL